MPDSPLLRVAALSAGLTAACGCVAYGALGWSLARPDAGALGGLPAASREQARQLYSAVRLMPWSTEADTRLGEFFLANNRPAAAIVWLGRATDWDPKAWQAWYYLGLTRRVQQRYAEADAAFRRVTALNPDYVAAGFQAANILFAEGRYSEALVAYANLSRPGIDQARLAEAIGSALLMQKEYQDAARSFRRALARFARYGDAYAGLAEALRQTGDEDTAHLRQLAETWRGVTPPHTDDPLTERMEQDFPTPSTLFDKFARAPDPKNAAEALEEALAMDPGMTRAWEQLIPVYGQAHRPRDAELAWSHLVKLDPRNVPGRCDLGIALGQAGDRGRAEAYLREALAIDPSYARAYRMLGQLAQLDGKTEEALRHYQTAVAKDPSMADAYVDMGVLLLKSGRTTEGEAQLLRALLPPCDQPERVLTRELAALRGLPFEESVREAVRSQAERKEQPSLIALLNAQARPTAPPGGPAGIAPP
jgi:tetratricopeptide (TPR) repeat protein